MLAPDNACLVQALEALWPTLEGMLWEWVSRDPCLDLFLRLSSSSNNSCLRLNTLVHPSTVCPRIWFRHRLLLLQM